MISEFEITTHYYYYYLLLSLLLRQTTLAFLTLFITLLDTIYSLLYTFTVLKSKKLDAHTLLNFFLPKKLLLANVFSFKVFKSQFKKYYQHTEKYV
jgi:hypothetical protein